MFISLSGSTTIASGFYLTWHFSFLFKLKQQNLAKQLTIFASNSSMSHHDLIKQPTMLAIKSSVTIRTYIVIPLTTSLAAAFPEGRSTKLTFCSMVLLIFPSIQVLIVKHGRMPPQSFTKHILYFVTYTWENIQN